MLESRKDQDYIELMQHVDESFRTHLKSFCEALVCQPERGELLSLLGNLSTQLHLHFELEERDGYLGEAVEIAPRFSVEADRLLQQHAVLSEEVTALMDRVRVDDESESWWSEFVPQAEMFVRKLIEHEKLENKLVQDAYEEDIGDKD